MTHLVVSQVNGRVPRQISSRRAMHLRVSGDSACPRCKPHALEERNEPRTGYGALIHHPFGPYSRSTKKRRSDSTGEDGTRAANHNWSRPSEFRKAQGL